MSLPEVFKKYDFRHGYLQRLCLREGKIVVRRILNVVEHDRGQFCVNPEWTGVSPLFPPSGMSKLKKDANTPLVLYHAEKMTVFEIRKGMFLCLEKGWDAVSWDLVIMLFAVGVTHFNQPVEEE